MLHLFLCCCCGGASGPRLNLHPSRLPPKPSSRELYPPCPPCPLQAGDKIEVFEIVKKSLKLEEAKAATADMQLQPADADADA